MDRTGSLNPEHREEAIRLLSDGFPHFIGAASCTELVAGTFADEGAWTPRSWFQIPEHPEDVDCSAAQPDSLTGTTSLLAGLSGFGQHFRDQAIRECQDEQSRLQKMSHSGSSLLDRRV